MIDPGDITDYNLNTNMLEERLLFWICAAGKNGRVAAKNLHRLLAKLSNNYLEDGPFNVLREYVKGNDLSLLMKDVGIGCYNSKSKSFVEVIDSGIDLATCSSTDLEKFYGIGMKTSRCFILHSRKGALLSGLDTHILKFLRRKGVEGVPLSTPNSKKLYLRLESEFLKIAMEENRSPADLDLEIWNYYSLKSGAQT